ncbi:MAG TPA: hypothetical protein VIV27_05315, partial [Halioglobus sp.]
MPGKPQFTLPLLCVLVGVQTGCSLVDGKIPVQRVPLVSSPATVPAPTAISDRGAQEHGKVWPMSIDSAYMGVLGENRNSAAGLVTNFEQRRIAGQSEYLSWTAPNSPQVSSLVMGSTEASNGLIIAASPRGGGTSSIVALDLDGKVVWRTEEWTGEDRDGDGMPDQAGQRNAVASSAGLQAPMVDREGGVYVADNYGIWKLNQDTGERIWFSRFLDYSDNHLGTSGLRLVNEGQDGLVGTVFASGWHIWVDRRDGQPVIVQSPDAFAAHDCPELARLTVAVSGGELDKSGELRDLACLRHRASTRVPQPNDVVIRPRIAGAAEHARYIFTYAGREGDPDNGRLVAYDFTYHSEKDKGWGIAKAWEQLVLGGTGAAPMLSPDLEVAGIHEDSGALRVVDVETGATISTASAPVDSFRVTADLADPTAAADIAAQALPQKMNSYAIPSLWETTPVVHYSGGVYGDLVRVSSAANIGYPYYFGTLLGKHLRGSDVTPTAMVPVTFDAATGRLMPGQTFGPELARPGMSGANAMVTTTGRYVVPGADLPTLFYYYLLQGQFNTFNSNGVHYDDISEAELTRLKELSKQFQLLGPVPIGIPIGRAGVVPGQWKIPQPAGGVIIYEPLSFAAAARNQLEMDVGLVNFASTNLCLADGCALEEAAARLGYVAWNLDKAFQRQLKEAVQR